MSDIAAERIEAAKVIWYRIMSLRAGGPPPADPDDAFTADMGEFLRGLDAVSPQPEQVGWWNDGMFLYMDEQGPVKADPEHWKPVVVHHG